MIFVRDPKLLKKITVHDFEYFTDHRTIVDSEMDQMMGKMLFSLKKQKWKKMRSLLSPVFTGSKMRLMFDYVANVGQQTAETIKIQTKNGKSSEFEFKELSSKLTVDVIASTAFGIEVNSFENPGNDFQVIAKKATNFNNIKKTLKLAGFMAFPSLMKKFKISFFDKEVENFFQKVV
jgi:cytochrome P450 family 9